MTDWLATCREAVEDVQRVLVELPTRVEREPVVGAGEGGDDTVAIDAASEEAIVRRLEATGASFTLVSEELGERRFGDGGDGLRVVVDPIDGSLNAKRGIPFFSLSLAVAEGDTMGDVAFGYVYDFGVREEWSAKRGEGAQLNGRRIVTPPLERRDARGRLELVGIESADPRWVAASAEVLKETCHRLRAIGSIALSLCQVATTRLDGMVTLWKCRAVDAAAAQLVVRESGGHVAFTAFDDPLGAPLDLAPHSSVVAARTEQAVAELARVPFRPNDPA